MFRKSIQVFFTLEYLTSFEENIKSYKNNLGEQNENSKQCHVNEYIEALR